MVGAGADNKVSASGFGSRLWPPALVPAPAPGQTRELATELKLIQFYVYLLTAGTNNELECNHDFLALLQEHDDLGYLLDISRC